MLVANVSASFFSAEKSLSSTTRSFSADFKTFCFYFLSVGDCALGEFTVSTAPRQQPGSTLRTIVILRSLLLWLTKSKETYASFILVEVRFIPEAIQRDHQKMGFRPVHWSGLGFPHS